MKNEKIKISSSLILVKILFSVMTFVFLKMVIENHSNIDIDFKTITEYKIGLIVFFLASFYFFTRPQVYYDNNNLYIKRINKKEMSIPYKNILSIYNSFIGGRGTSNLSIVYFTNNKEKKSVKFNVENSDRIYNLLGLVKSTNPDVEIV